MSSQRKNTTKAVNTYAIPVATYSFGIVKWTPTDLEGLNRMIRVEHTKHRAHHPKSSVERFHLQRTEGGRGVVDLVYLHHRQVNNLRGYFHEKTNHNYYKTICESDKNFTPLNLSCTEDHPLDQKATPTGKLEAWARKELHGRFRASITARGIDKSASFSWLKHGGLFKETEGFITAIQDKVIPTLNYRKYILKDGSSNDNCRLCNSFTENIEHLTGGCQMLAPKEYTERHDNVAKVVHMRLVEKIKKERHTEPYYRYNPETVIDTPIARLYWDRTVLTDHAIIHNRPDIIYTNKTQKTTYLIDIAIPNADNVHKKYSEKIQKYIPLANEIKDLWGQDRVQIVPVIIGSTGEIPESLFTSMNVLGIERTVYMEIQRIALLETSRIVRKVLNLDNNTY